MLAALGLARRSGPGGRRGAAMSHKDDAQLSCPFARHIGQCQSRLEREFANPLGCERVYIFRRIKFHVGLACV